MARLLQVLGFSEVTLALLLGLNPRTSMGLYMGMAAFGAALFYLGRWLER
ncbi:MAG: hypothetical protein HYY20_07160 [Candidatus Tectomicrobia bacterium]|uniref:Uncharacterized protein n=1 Tax=Tectimicrobiota bacterium TaxID=2528274 RepID=A0A932FWM6_UNCTE|nr:hypothetical protein [Candidatus Tectomicrobia bacterium]